MTHQRRKMKNRIFDLQTERDYGVGLPGVNSTSLGQRGPRLQDPLVFSNADFNIQVCKKHVHLHLFININIDKKKKTSNTSRL